MAIHPAGSAARRRWERRLRTAFALLLLLVPVTAAWAAPLDLTVPGPDGSSVVAQYYRPVRPSSAGVALFPGANGRIAQWAALSDSLAARGWHVLVADVATGVRSTQEVKRGRAPAPEDEAARWVLRALALLRESAGDSLSPLVLGGADFGAAAAVIGASRAERAPEGLVLLSPPAKLGEIPLAPVLAGLAGPFVVVTGREDAAAADAARAMYLANRSLCRLWECDGGAHGEELFRRGAFFLSDIAGWMAGLPGRKAPAGANGRPESSGRARG